MSFCDPDEISGMFKAAMGLEHRSDLTDRESTVGLNRTANPAKMAAGYEEMMSLSLTQNPANNTRYTDTAFDEAVKTQSLQYNKGQMANWAGRASDFLGEKFMAPINREINYWKETLDPDQLKSRKGLKESFVRDVVPEIKQIRLDIKDAWRNNNYGKTKADKANINKSLEPYGIEWNRTKEAVEYLEYLETGQLYADHRNDVGEAFDRMASAQAGYNVAWTLFNMGDFLKVASYGVGQKGYGKGTVAGFKELAEGFMRDVKTRDIAYGGAMGKIKGLEAPIGATEHRLGMLDPFALSTRAIERFTTAKALAMGENPLEALGKAAFVFQEHDVPAITYKARLNPTGNKAVVGLGRFVLSELNYNLTNYDNVLTMGINALQGKAPTQQQKRQALEFVTHSALKASLFGTRAILPTFAYNALNSALGEDYEELLNWGVVNSTGDGLIKLVDEDASFSMAEAMAPPLWFLGARSKQLADAFNAIPNTLDKLGKQNEEGELDLGSAIEIMLMVGTVSSAIPSNLRMAAGPAGVLKKIDDSPFGNAIPWLENRQMQNVIKALIEDFREQRGTPAASVIKEGLLGKRIVKDE
jgi:hypothetical protein